MKDITIQITSEELDMLEDYLVCELDENRKEQYRRTCISIWGRLVRQYDSEDKIERVPYKCSNCNSTNVQAKAWVGLNDKTDIDFSLAECDDFKRYYCHDCQDAYIAVDSEEDEDFYNSFMETK